MNNGWVKINRRILDWRWYSCSEMVHLFFHLILKASTEDKSWQNIIVRRGQLVTSVANLSVELGISVQKIRTCLERLKSTGEIEIKTTNKYSVISICKYELYQDITTDEQQTNNNQITNEQQTNNNQITTSKELKNNIITCINTCMSVETPDAQKTDIDTAKFLLFFNSEMDKTGASIKRAKSITGNRLAMLHARCREHGKEAVCDVIRKAAKSDFLNGGGNRGFVADFTWIFRPTNFIRIFEGFYDNNQTHKNHGNNQQVDQAKRRGFAVTATSSKDYKTTF